MPHRRWKIIACLFLVAATLATYGDLRTHQFTNFDDQVYITDNPPVQAGLTLKGLTWAFTTLHAGLWIPLTWLSFMVDSQFFGLHPGGFLLTNLLFHIANSLLLFLWLLYLTRTLGCSFMVAALFALHPLHVESVAWATERKDVLSTFFWLLTMWAYVWYAERPRLGRYLLILVCFSLGLMAKPMLVTLPFVLLLLDYWPLGRLSLKGPGLAAASPKLGPGVTLKRLVWEKSPLLVVAALSIVVTFYAQKEAGATWNLHNLPISQRLANVMVAYVSYLGKMFWPAPLAVFYPLPGHNPPIWQAPAAGLALAVLTFWALRQTRRHPYLPAGWLWYLGTLLPVVGLVQVGMQSMADRFTYVPLIGLFIILAYGMADLAARWRAPGFLLPVGAGVVLSALMICTWVQVSHWRGSISLYEHTLKVTRRNPVIHVNLGVALAAQGKLDQAMAHYAEALRLEPDDAQAHNNLGLALAAQARLDQAVAHYAEALRLNPDLAEAHNNLGLALAAQGKLEQAAAHYAEALHLNPDLAAAHNNLGLALAKQGKLDQAVAHYAEALRLNPDLAAAHNNLGLALAKQGKLDQAMAHYAEALRLKPDFIGAHNNLGLALAKEGKLDQAVAHYTEALRLKPDLAAAHNNLGLALAAQGKLDQAVAHYAEALRLQPGLATVHNNLGLALAAQGKWEQAVAHYAEALRLNPDFAEAHNNLGLALAAQGKLEQAVANYGEAQRLQPGLADIPNNLGVALAQQGKLDGAITMFQKAIQIKPDFSVAYSNLGLAYAKQGNIDQAIIIFQNALKINPNNTLAQKKLSTLKAQGPHN
ncbi:MAG: tetratricopeptide repeat protein [Desulfobaccales bacterium]|jgi:tetratricopeptide (TPR) repeat protein